MYLKRLDLQGFKSFPEKVKLEFTPGITAVVGPNGSGKSNVSDAVRWVLGEQRAKNLRGDKMEDIIFAGTETRKPQGFAEVTIVIDNQDERLPVAFSEVQVTRRVFRSGESEYRINGTACRLKDIQELFMDTGIGREGYSIIGQGRIDEILNAKGDERRRIFEEATGIVKYKTRKNEAENKLEREHQNLLRVEDILTELESQLLPLEEESKKAKVYMDLREQLKIADMAMFCKEMENIEQEAKHLVEVMANAAMQQKEAKQTGAAEQERLTQTKQQIDDKNTAMQQLHTQLTQTKTDLEKTEGQIRLSEEQQQNDAANIARMEKELVEKQQQQKNTQAQQEVSQSRIQTLQMTMQKAEETLSQMEADYDARSQKLQESETQAENAKDEIFEQIRIGTEAKGEISKRQAMLEQFSGRRDQLDHELAHVQSRLEQQQVHGQVLQKKAKEQQELIAFLEKELYALKQDHEHASDSKQKSERLLATKEKQSSEIRSRLSLLEELERDHEGYYHSVKSLLNLPDQEKRGICGAVGQLLTVPESYETAIESALGGALQNVVTNTEEDAKNAIYYLKQRRLGRATFLPIGAVHGRGLEGHPRILDEKGVLGTAESLVAFAEKYRGIMSYLLGRILVVETLEDAVSLAKRYSHQYKMVTLEGDLLNPGGSMTGGSQSKKTSNLFGRIREIQHLRTQMAQADTEIAQLREELQLSEEDLQEISEQMMEKRLELQKVSVTIHTREAEWQKNEQDIVETTNKHKLLALEAEQLEDQVTRMQQDIVASKEVLQKSEEAMERANAALSSVQEDLSEEKQKKEQLLQEMTQTKIRITQNMEQIEAAQETWKRLQSEEQGVVQDMEKLQKQIAVYRESGGKRTETQESLHQKVEMLQKAEEALQQKLEETKEQIAALTTSIAQMEQSIQEAMETASKLDAEQVRVEAKQDKLEENKQRICDRMWDEYEITYFAARELTKEEKRHYAELQRLSKEWKEEMRRLGDVNVQAIAQYQEVEERYTFLTAQKTDILDAEQKLRQLIDELTELMKKQFAEQFAVISKNFSEVFCEIFGGGKAHLQLADDHNVLNSAIDIVAQPPGKSLQNMQLLSGGERALTAIAVLFAILKMKPSPFCILDEIEAALDDANVKRYAQYLTRFSEDTQFIVITHRKGTMEYADILYGVTMQEKGVSKLISLDFSTQKEDIK